MRKIPILALCFSLAVSSPCIAGTLIPVVPVSGSSSTSVNGINDDNLIAGSYTDLNGSHSFDGTLDGTYTTFDIKGASYSGASAINNLGNIIGNSSVGAFEASESGSYGIIGQNNKKHKPLNNGTAEGINNNGEFVGSYYDSKSGLYRGYYGSSSTYNGDINMDVSTGSVYAYGINKSGWVVGYAFFVTDNTYHAFLLKNGEPTIIDYAGEGGPYHTIPRAINDNGLVVGSYEKDNKYFGFFYDANKGTFKSLAVKKAKDVSIMGINNNGYATVFTDRGSFIYCPLKKKKCFGK